MIYVEDKIRYPKMPNWEKIDEWRSKSIPYNDNMPYAMDEVIKDKLERFVFQIVTFARQGGFTKAHVDPKLDVPDNIDKILSEFPISRPDNYKEQLPVLDIDNELDMIEEDEEVNVLRALAKDQKFLKLLNKMRKDFLGGSEIFL